MQFRPFRCFFRLAGDKNPLRLLADIGRTAKIKPPKILADNIHRISPLLRDYKRRHCIVKEPNKHGCEKNASYPSICGNSDIDRPGEANKKRQNNIL